MGSTLTRGLSRVHALLVVAVAATVVLLVQTAGAFAAADPTTGIDYKADVADKVIAAAQPALLAGLAVMVLLIAVSLGKRLWGKVSGAR